MAEGSGVVKTLAIGICAATFIGGALFAHAIDAPHTIYPQEVRDMADVVQGALIISRNIGEDSSKRAREHVSNDSAERISDIPSPTVAQPTLIGRCSGKSLTTQGRSLLLGDRTASPPGDGFVNFANRVCFWRTSGIRSNCPPPEDCREKME